MVFSRFLFSMTNSAMGTGHHSHHHMPPAPPMPPSAASRTRLLWNLLDADRKNGGLTIKYDI
jgi:hypothetical protein